MPHASVAALAPTPERSRHNPVVILDRLDDSAGAISRPAKALDTLAAMLDAGTIDSRKYNAGTQFRDDFRRANLDPLRCTDLSKPRVDCPATQDIGNTALNARERIHDALATLGSPGDSLAWHVLGYEATLADWARRYSTATARLMLRQTASGVLIQVLASLATHYYGAERKQKASHGDPTQSLPRYPYPGENPDHTANQAVAATCQRRSRNVRNAGARGRGVA